MTDRLDPSAAETNRFSQKEKPGNRLRWWGDLALLALMAMDAFWITDWYDALVRPNAGWTGAGLCILIILVFSHGLARVIAQMKLKPLTGRLIFLAWLLVTLLLSLWVAVYAGEALTPADLFRRVAASFLRFGSDLREFWHLFILAWVVYRGLSLAREPLQVYTGQASFQLGLFLLLIYGLLFGWGKSNQALVTSYGFLFCAIIAMSAARVSTLSELRGGRLPALRAAWFWGILGVAALIVGLAVAVGWFATHIVGDILYVIYLAVFTAAILVGMLVLSPLLLLILALGPTLRDLLAVFINIPLFQELSKFIQSMAERAGITPEWIAGVAQIGRPTLLLGVLLGVFLIVLIAAVWKPWKQRFAGEENASTLPLRAALSFPRLLLRRFSGRLPKGGRLLAAARVRHVYAQLMALAARLGKPRPLSATPLEFLPSLQDLFPGEESNLDAITRAYLKIRYGELPETYEEVRQVLLGWDRLRKQGKKLLHRH